MSRPPFAPLYLSTAILAAAAIISHAGPLNPPAGTVASTHKLQDARGDRAPLRHQQRQHAWLDRSQRELLVLSTAIGDRP